MTFMAGAAVGIVAAAIWILTGAIGSVDNFRATSDVSRGVVNAAGAFNPILTVAIGSSVSGIVQEVFCDYNTKVRKGQLCARIDPRPYQTVVDQDQASLATAKAQLEKDRANLVYANVRSREYAALLAQNAISQDQAKSLTNEALQARAQVALDNASVDQHAAILKTAEVYLEYTNIVSPIDGIIVSRYVAVGQTITANFQTPTLFVASSDLSKMEIDAEVAEGDIGAVRIGDKAIFSVKAFPRREFYGVVSQIRNVPQKAGNTVNYGVVITADNPELLFKPGMTAEVRILTNADTNVAMLQDRTAR